MTRLVIKLIKLHKKKSIILIAICASLMLILSYYLIHGQNEPGLIKRLEANQINTLVKEERCKNYDLNKYSVDLDWQKYAIVPDKCKNRIIILSQHRSGSSFFGSLLQQSWPTYYLYEPLYYLGDTINIDEIKDENKVGEALDTMARLFNCKCLNETRDKRKIYWALHWNKVMKGFKNEKEKLANTEQVCQRCQNVIVKSVRINVKFLVDLFNKFESVEKPLKIVVLLRDPRAIINSRLNPSLGFCYGQCRDPGLVCQQIRSNINSIIDLNRNSSKLLDHLTIIRYEDLSLNTKSLAKKLYQRLDLSYTKTVEEWIQNKTEEKRHNLKTPLRNTTENVISWTKTFKDWKLDLNSVQNQCSDVMQMLGYKTISLQELNKNKPKDPSRFISDNFPLKDALIKNFISP